MPLKSALLRDFGGCCFAVTLLKVAFMVIRGDLKKNYCNDHGYRYCGGHYVHNSYSQ